MDGTILALDAKSRSVKQSQLRSLAVPALVGTMLAGLLFLAFYASPLLFASPDARNRIPEAQVPIDSSSPSPEPAASQSPVDQPSPDASPEIGVGESSEQVALSDAGDKNPAETNHTNSRPADSRLTIKRGLPPLPRVGSLPRLPPARVGKQGASSPRDNDRERVELTSRQSNKPSRVGSFLKKTGRLIKKPFKL